jgi:hypothetical protein
VRRKSRPFVEPLEDRITPATFGVPWLSAARMTVSFAPDGTQAGGGQSQLFKYFGTDQNHASTWELPILEALQTWADQANIDLGLVQDGGQPFGTSGLIQGDPRFGDIRIAMAPLGMDLVAQTAPFGYVAGTNSGDMILNSNYNIGVNPTGATPAGRYDLFTVALHEAGHVFGFADETTDPNSVMYADYTGPRVGLAPEDVAALQQLYGPRHTINSLGATNNNSLATAAPLTLTTGPGLPPGQASVFGGLDTLGQADYYAVTTPANKGDMTFQVRTSGISLLAPTLTVYDASGNVLQTVSALSPINADQTITLHNLPANTTYYVSVGNVTGDVFGIGTYQLAVAVGGNVQQAPPSPGTNAAPIPSSSLQNALQLPAGQKQGYGLGHTFAYTGSGHGEFSAYFSFTAPASRFGTLANAVIMLQTLEGKPPAHLQVFDSAGNPVAFSVLTNDQFGFTIQATNLTPGSAYVVEAFSPPDRGGHVTDMPNFTMTVDFPSVAEEGFQTVTQGAVSTANPTASGTLQVNQTGTIELALAAYFQNAGMTGSGTVTMTVLDSHGHNVATLTSIVGQPMATFDLFLNAGSYTVQFSSNSTTLQTSPVDYTLEGDLLGDAIGPQTTGGTTSRVPNPPPTYTWINPSPPPVPTTH